MANRSYTAEFRAQAVELSFLPGKTVIGVARDLGVNPKTLHFWRHQARKDGTVPAPETRSGPELPAEIAAELRDLRERVRDQDKRLREQEQEIEILSKATAWFAARNPNGSR
jgi:transposase